MSGISQIEIWLYIGVALMILAVITGIFSTLIYSVTGRKLRRTLEKEYGKLRRNSRNL